VIVDAAVDLFAESGVAHLPSCGLGGADVADLVDRVIDAILERHKLARLIYIESSDPSSPAFEITERSFEGIYLTVRRSASAARAKRG
jgi:hypothetical protein